MLYDGVDEVIFRVFFKFLYLKLNLNLFGDFHDSYLIL